MDQQQLHMNSKIRELTDQIHEMTHQYDTKLLAIVLLSQAGSLLQACNSVGFMTADETERTIAEALKDVYTPLPADEMPRIETIGKPMRLS